MSRVAQRLELLLYLGLLNVAMKGSRLWAQVRR